MGGVPHSCSQKLNSPPALKKRDQQAVGLDALNVLLRGGNSLLRVAVGSGGAVRIGPVGQHLDIHATVLGPALASIVVRNLLILADAN